MLSSTKKTITEKDINLAANSTLKAKDVSANVIDFDESHPLFGRICVFTGKLEKLTRAEAMQVVANFGGVNADNVTKNTNFLVLGNNDFCTTLRGGKSNKHKKAEKLALDGQDIQILSENAFYDMISE